MDITDKLETEIKRIVGANSKFTNINYKIKDSDILVVGDINIPFKDLQLHAIHSDISAQQIEKSWLYRHIGTEDRYHLTAWYQRSMNLEHLLVEKVSYTDDYLVNQLGYTLCDSGTDNNAEKHYRLKDKNDLLEALTEINNYLLAITSNALNDKGFLSWMSTTTVTEDDVNYKTWYYGQSITVKNTELTINTSILYDAYTYNGNDEEYYSLENVIHTLDFGSQSDLCVHFFNLFYNSLCGRNYSTTIDIMVMHLEKELGIYVKKESRSSIKFKEHEQRESINEQCNCIDPDDFFNSI